MPVKNLLYLRCKILNIIPAEIKETIKESVKKGNLLNYVMDIFLK